MKVIRILLILIISLFFASSAYAVDILMSTFDDNIQFMIVDYNGKRTGYDPSIKSVVSESGLPNMMYEEWNPANPALSEAEEPNELTYDLQGRFPIDMQPFNIKVVITGMRLAYSKIVLSFRENKSGLSFPQNSKSVIMYPILDINQTATYEIAYVPLQSLVATKAANPNDLIADINAASKLGYVGNAEFVNELIKKVQKIEKERTAVQKPEESKSDKEKEHLTPTQKAIKEDKELLKEITEKYQRPEADEFVKQEAYTVLKEDLDYIIGHIQ